MGYFGWYDPTYVLVIIGVIICLIASANVNSTFSRYSRVRSASGMTGAEVAARILSMQGLNNVRIEHIDGNLTDHFDPSTNTVRLSDSVYGAQSIAAAGVAAHECGHAIQYARGYVPLNIRTALVPVANFGSAISWPLIVIGLILGAGYQTIHGTVAGALIIAGIWCFAAAVLFQIVTLPVEFNASRRALKELEKDSLLTGHENGMARRVLIAAALTYVAGALSAILQLLRIILITRDDR
jgi:Zn-dependent membrane protease YugP